MKVRTHDGMYEIVTDETPQGFYLIWLPTRQWIGLGMICDLIPSLEEARQIAYHMVSRYADLTVQGYGLQNDSEGWFFSREEGERCPFQMLGENSDRVESVTFTPAHS